jgi:hypothetical protein
MYTRGYAVFGRLRPTRCRHHTAPHSVGISWKCVALSKRNIDTIDLTIHESGKNKSHRHIEVSEGLN